VQEIWVKIYLPELFCRLFVLLLLFYRRLRYGFPFRKIPLTQGQFAIVDEDDFKTLAGYKWYAMKSGRSFYAQRMKYSKKAKTRQIPVQMHREILNAPEGALVDHINHNGLDNRRANLRLATAEQNSWNRRKNPGNFTSKYKGVSWNKLARKWQARIAHKQKWIVIGFFDDEQSAAKAYDKKAAELFGEFACLNFPKQ
jgi:hypothetical protein